MKLEKMIIELPSCHFCGGGIKNDVNVVPYSALTDLDQLLIKKRAAPADEIEAICDHHIDYFFKYFSSRQEWCCDPFKKHKIRNNYRLEIITLHTALEFSQISAEISLVPGKKLCNNCVIKVKEFISTKKTIQSNPSGNQSQEPDLSQNNVNCVAKLNQEVMSKDDL